MGGFNASCLWLLLSLSVATFAHPEHGLQSLHLNTIEKRELDTFRLHKRCVGSCEDCFGSGYQECASSSTICFKPSDPQHGEETCSSSSTTVPAVPTFDFCSDGSCETCFGAGSTECPGSTSQCYTPGDSKSGIESCSSSSSDSSGTTTSSSSDTPVPSTGLDSSSTAGSNITTTDFCDTGDFDCKRCFGDTYIPCPDAPNSYCYDPNNSTSICPDGTSPAGSSDSSSSDSDSATYSGSTTYTASTPAATADTGSPAGTSGATGTGDAGTNVIGSTTSPASTNSRTSSAVGSSQTSATSGNSNGNPVNATTNGQPSMGEGVYGVLAVLTVCFTSFVGLIF